MIHFFPPPLFIIHLNRTDGDIIIKRVDSELEMQKYLVRTQLGREDYAVIKGGELLKSFDNKSEPLVRKYLKKKLAKGV